MGTTRHSFWSFTITLPLCLCTKIVGLIDCQNHTGLAQPFVQAAHFGLKQK